MCPRAPAGLSQDALSRPSWGTTHGFLSSLSVCLSVPIHSPLLVGSRLQDCWDLSLASDSAKSDLSPSSRVCMGRAHSLLRCYPRPPPPRCCGSPRLPSVKTEKVSRHRRRPPAANPLSLRTAAFGNSQKFNCQRGNIKERSSPGDLVAAGSGPTPPPFQFPRMLETGDQHPFFSGFKNQVGQSKHT